MRLGHRVAGEDLAVEERLEIALLLIVGAVVREDLGVAGVGRLAPEDDRRPLRPPEDLVEQRELELSVALAAELRAQVRRPQVVAPHFLLERVEDLAQLLVGRCELQPRKHEVERLDFLADELVGPVQLRLVLGVGLEVPCHGTPPGRLRGYVSDVENAISENRQTALPHTA